MSLVRGLRRAFAFGPNSENTPELGKRPFKIISFYTSNNEYAEHAARLVETLDRFGLESNVVPVDLSGSWELNCATKARFVQREWESSDVPIVWLDADATVEEYPQLFEEIVADFAIHRWDGWQFGSGTIFFNKTLSAKRLIDQWVYRCEADPLTWDQVHLQSAWCDISAVDPLTTAWLPRSYLQIFNKPAQEAPVIKHWQASRALKADGRAVGAVQFGLTDEGLRQRHNCELWRTPEEAFWILEGTKHIKPERGHEYPEGFDVGAILRTAIGDSFPVLEIGCGVGRIARLFQPEEYLGVDVNPSAIRQARSALSNHNIRLIDNGMKYPDAACALFYTVLLHVSDTSLPSILSNVLAFDKVVIAEVMDTRWRREGDPPVFNRDPEQYILLMQAHGYQLTNVSKTPYLRYDKPPFNIGKDSRLTALSFERRS